MSVADLQKKLEEAEKKHQALIISVYKREAKRLKTEIQLNADLAHSSEQSQIDYETEANEAEIKTPKHDRSKQDWREIYRKREGATQARLTAL
eukprot:3938561-Rhodomonas_salina.1